MRQTGIHIDTASTSVPNSQRRYNEEEQIYQTYSSTERHSLQHPSQSRLTEVVFYSCENLFRESLVGHKEIAMKKNCKCKFAFDSTRSFESYCYEFCGLLNVQMKDLKFYLGNREIGMQRLVRKPVLIEVHFSFQNDKQDSNNLKPAYRELLQKGVYSDIQIILGEETIKAHKCILMARSEKFKAMLTNNMKETTESKLTIPSSEIRPQIYKLLLQWIYEGECELPDAVMDVIELLKLTDEYLLPDLEKACEIKIINQLDSNGAVEILTNPLLVFPQSCDQQIREAAKTIFLDDYEKIEEQIPDIEEKISQVKGLMSELFVHKKKKLPDRKKRKNSILGEDAQKKKVRFNISSTIYDEASAIHDDSDSMIEPLSIYSNSSPPGDLNDDIIIGSTHSRNALSGTNSNNPNVNSERRNSGVISNQNAHRSEPQLNSVLRFNRPGSAGRGEQTGYRSGSPIAIQESQTQQEGENDQHIFGYTSRMLPVNRSLI